MGKKKKQTSDFIVVVDEQIADGCFSSSFTIRIVCCSVFFLQRHIMNIIKQIECSQQADLVIASVNDNRIASVERSPR